MNPSLTFRIGEFKTFTAWREKVPTKTPVSNAAFKNHDRSIDSLANVMTNSNLRTDLAFPDLHPLVVELPRFTRASTPHHADVAHILALGPITLVINKVRIEIFFLHGMLERPFTSTNLAKPKHVGLSHQDIDLNRLAHVGGLPIRIGKLGACDTGKAKTHGSQKARCVTNIFHFHKYRINSLTLKAPNVRREQELSKLPPNLLPHLG